MCLKATCVKCFILLNIIIDDKRFVWKAKQPLWKSLLIHLSVHRLHVPQSLSWYPSQKNAFHLKVTWDLTLVSIHLKAEIQDFESLPNSSKLALNPLKTELGNILGQFWLKTTFKLPICHLILYSMYILYIKCKIFHWSIHWL